MNLQQRINLLIQLGNYFIANNEEWIKIKENAQRENGWFTQNFIELAITNITQNFLNREKLVVFATSYTLPEHQKIQKTIGLVMAGNIPLVGFHDWLCIFLIGHKALIKASTKDQVLIKHIALKLNEWDAETCQQTQFAEMLKGCDAYIATGSNNTARYFEYYFGKYPNIIRRNRTSVAILNGKETAEQLDNLADDVHQYYGLGCRNVTKIWVPAAYDFIPLLTAFKKYEDFANHNKYKNNYDYQLAIALLNKIYYMTNGSILLIENQAIFSPISQLHYEYYTNLEEIMPQLHNNNDIQCVISNELTLFGKAQQPSLTDFADGIDAMKFLFDL